MGTIALIVLLSIEVFFLAWSVKSRTNHALEKSIVRISEFAMLGILLLTGVFDWGFRYLAILIVLAVQVVISVTVLAKKTEKPYKPIKNLFGLLSRGTFLQQGKAHMIRIEFPLSYGLYYAKY